MKIFPTFKGLVFGNLWIRIKGEHLNFSNKVNAKSGHQINFFEFDIYMCEVSYVLVIEKETIFFNLLT